MTKFNYFIIVMVCALAIKGNAQTYETGKETKKADINFTDVEKYCAEHPEVFKIKFPQGEDEGEESENNLPKPRRTKKADVHVIDWNRAGRITAGAAMGASPAPSDTFQSTLTDGTSIPPDTHGAVDSQYCVTAVNTSFHIQTRTGVNVSMVGIDAFWASVLPSGTDGYDPRIHYDPYYQRWIYITDAINLTTNQDSYLLIAVSATNNPRGTWHMFQVQIDATNATWLDFPCVGFNHQWVTVSGNIFNTAGSFQKAAIYVFNYADLMSGASATFTKMTETGSFTMCPALTYDTTQLSMFLMDVNKPSTGKLQLWKISGPVGTPTIASVGYPVTTTTWQNGGSADFVPQLGTTEKLQADDDRITNLTYRNHTLWCAHTVFLPATGTATRCSVMWWQIDTNATPAQNGLLDDAQTPSFFDFPSISVNQNNDALVGFSYTNATMHPSCAYALHLGTDPTDSMRKPVIFRHGQADYYQTFGGTQNRWGDFSATTVDPLNNVDFWTIQESVPSTPTDYWDTWWANIHACSASSSYTIKKDTLNKNIADTITFTGSAPTGTIFTWNFGGGVATPDTGKGPISVKWATFGWKVITLKDSINGCSSTYTDSVWVVNLAGVAQVNGMDKAVNIVPNPSTGNFEIQFQLAMPVTIAVIRLNDAQGRLVYEKSFDGITDNKVYVNAENLANGLYLANILIDNDVISEKIMVNK